MVQKISHQKLLSLRPPVSCAAIRNGHLVFIPQGLSVDPFFLFKISPSPHFLLFQLLLCSAFCSFLSFHILKCLRFFTVLSISLLSRNTLPLGYFAYHPRLQVSLMTSYFLTFFPVQPAGQLHLDCHRDTSNSPCQSELIIFVSRPVLHIFPISPMIPSILLPKPSFPLLLYDFYLLNLLTPLHPHYHCGCLYFVTSETVFSFPCLQSYPISSHS